MSLYGVYILRELYDIWEMVKQYRFRYASSFVAHHEVSVGDSGAVNEI